MPLRKIDFMSSVLALAEPVPFTVAILIEKSLIRGAVEGDMDGFAFVSSWRAWPAAPGRPRCTSGDLRLLRRQGLGLVLGMGPMHVGLLHVPGGRRAALRAQAAVNTQILVLHHDAARLRERHGDEQRLREILRGR